jgi:hypothetical protein
VQRRRQVPLRHQHQRQHQLPQRDLFRRHGRSQLQGSAQRLQRLKRPLDVLGVGRAGTISLEITNQGLSELAYKTIYQLCLLHRGLTQHQGVIRLHRLALHRSRGHWAKYYDQQRGFLTSGIKNERSFGSAIGEPFFSNWISSRRAS